MEKTTIRNSWLKNNLLALVSLLVAIASVALGIFNYSMSASKTQFEQTDERLAQVTRRLEDLRSALSVAPPAVQPRATQLWSAASKDVFDARSAWLDRDYNKAEQLLRGADTKIRNLNDLLPVPPPPSYPWSLVVSVVVAAVVVTLIVVLISHRPDRNRHERY